jgi:ABC-type nitrate/sulfonate/bicarbonate transport system substrate-binding protein
MRLTSSRRSARTLAWMALALALVSLAACGEANNDEGGGGGDGGSAVELNFSTGIDPVFSPVFLAQTEKLFDEAGLNVTVHQFAQGTEGVDAIIAGQMQFGVPTDSSFLTRAARSDLRALGIIAEDKGHFVKLVLGKGIDSPQQIKKMGIVPGSISELGAVRLLEHEKIPRDSVEFVEAGSPELPALLDKGDIDAFVIQEPGPTQAREMGATVKPSATFGLSYVVVVVASGKWVDENRETARQIMEVLGEAADRVESDPDAAAAATQEQTKTPPDLTKQVVDELDFGVRDFTPRDIENFERISNYLHERGFIEKKVDVDSAVEQGLVSGGEG